MNNAQVITIFILGMLLGSVLTLTIQHEISTYETQEKCAGKGGIYLSGKCVKVEEIK